MQHHFKLGDTEHAVGLSRAAHGYRLHLDEQTLAVDLEPGRDGQARLTVGEHHYDIVVAAHGDDVFVQLQGEAYALRHVDPLTRLVAAGGAAAGEIRAPMPGSIVSVAVAAGDTVTLGQPLLVMESMKMETTITAPRDGIVAEVNHEKGQTFERDALLLRLEPVEDSK